MHQGGGVHKFLKHFNLFVKILYMKNYIHCHFTGALRSEKIEMTAQLKKQQARIQYLEGMVEKLNKEVC